MKKVCTECKYIYEYNDLDIKEITKCPRCGKIYIEKRSCENCKGCSYTQLLKKGSCDQGCS